MVRINFNLFLWVAEQEAKRLDTTVRSIYQSAYMQLSTSYAIAAQEARGTEDLDDADRSNYLGWLAEEYREQRAALGAVTFALLWRTVKFHLESTVWIGNRLTHQSSPKGSHLDKIVGEYGSRFGVRLEQLSHFATVREIVLARNSAIHNGNQAVTTWVKQRTVA